MGQYYTLGAELPDLKVDQGSLDLSSADVWEKMRESFSARDLRQMRLLFLEEDQRVLLKLLRGEPVDEDNSPKAIGKKRLSELVEYLNKLPETETPEPSLFSDIPRYMVDFSRDYLQGEYEGTDRFPEDILNLHYHRYLEKKANGFLKDWFAFNRIIANVLAAQTAKKFDLDLSKYIVDSGELADTLRRAASSEIDALDNADTLRDIIKISEEPHLYRRERSLDKLRWDYLEDYVFPDIFSLDAMMVYFIKTRIIERWLLLDKEIGEKAFRQMIKTLNADGQEKLDDFVRKQNNKKNKPI